MIYHVVPLRDWSAASGRSYAPASLAADGFVHCSPDEESTLAVATAFYGQTPGPLLALLIDERRLDAPVRWEAADPEPPPGVPPATLFPHLYGPVDRDAVEEVRQIVRDEEGRATGLATWG
ncbi:DUF952 domain-containing protein [Streptomyces sp. NPDC093252]|uniref:DUF952 domain-containing protein n=1 Tax=Streptomyces sp. NPDC093252 TaxID=3154980 RepID=UPI0034318A08